MKTRTLGTALVAAATLWAAPAVAQLPEQTYQQQAFAATNHQRDRHDRVALRHQDLGRVLRDCGLRMAGENVAYGYPNGRSVVDEGWMHSERHHENILNSSYRLLGMGARRGDDGRWYAAQVFGRR